jgi:hypothetical protein
MGVFYRVKVNDPAGVRMLDTHICQTCIERVGGIPVVIPFVQQAQWTVWVEPVAEMQRESEEARGDGGLPPSAIRSDHA